MGGSCSSASATYAEGEHYKIPAGEQWRHAWCTVRVSTSCQYWVKKGKCDYRHIVDEVNRIIVMWASWIFALTEREPFLEVAVAFCWMLSFLHMYTWQLFIIAACSCWPRQTKREKGLGIQSHSPLSIKFSHIHTGVPRRSGPMNKWKLPWNVWEMITSQQTELLTCIGCFDQHWRIIC